MPKKSSRTKNTTRTTTKTSSKTPAGSKTAPKKTSTTTFLDKSASTTSTTTSSATQNKPSKLKQKLQSLSHTAKKRWKLLVILTLVIIGAGYYFNKSQASKQPKITTTTPAKRDLEKTLTVSGVVDAKQKAYIRFLAGGKVVYLGAKEGDSIKKGQTLASIDSQTLKKQLDSSLNTYLQERWGWENTLEANKDKTLDDTDQRAQDISQFELNKKVLQVEIQDIAIREASIYAPFAGILTFAPTTTVGTQLSATDFFEIVDPSSLIFRAQVDENDIASVSLNLPTTIELDSYPDKKIKSAINYISYVSAQTASGTVFLVEMSLDSADLNTYRIGMNGDVTIILEKKSKVLSLPLEAIRERDGKTLVDILDDQQKPQEKSIKIGLETEDYVEVLEGLTENDLVVLPE